MERNRHRFESATNTHVYWRLTDRYFLGVCCLPIGIVEALVYCTPVFGHSSSSGKSLATNAVLAAMLILIGITSLRPRVIVTPEGIIVRHGYGTKVASASEIQAISYGYVREGEGGFKVWCPYVELKDGSALWMTALMGGAMSRAVQPVTIEQVREIRRTLNVSGSDFTDREPQPLWRRGFGTLRGR